jgi:hypothetical protein
VAAALPHQDLDVGAGYLAREGLLCAVVSVAAALGALALFG